MPKLGQSFARIFIKFGYLWYAVSRLLNLLVQISQIYLHFPSSSNVLTELSSRAVCDTTMGHRFKFTFKPGFSQAFLVTAVAVLSTAMTLNFHVFLVFLHVSHCFLSNLLQAGLIKMGAKFAPCMRLDDNLRRVLEEERRVENETGCCVKSDGSGCIQTSREACSVSFYTCQTFGGLFILNFRNLLHFNFFHTCMSPCI